MNRSYVLVAVVFFVLSASQGQRNANSGMRYPNELPGYRLYAEGNWKALEPYVSKAEDVRKWLGKSSPVYIDYGADWQVIVFYFGSATVNNKPYGISLKDTVSSIVFRPRQRISFRDVHFPGEFHSSHVSISHSVVGYKRWSDGTGLSYLIYDEAAADGNIQRGDLAEIEYGASDDVEEKIRKLD